MFALTANKVHLYLTAKEELTSGSQNIYLCQFVFSDDWEGVDRTAVFISPKARKGVILGEDNACQIPHEVLEHPCPALYVGVYGTKNGELVMPTIQANLGKVKYGTKLGEMSKPPTPDLYDQILAAANNAEAIASSVREDADAGKFQGPAGKGFPDGGLAGQVLMKNSDEDFDTEWRYPSGGGTIPTDLGHGLILDNEGRLAVNVANEAQADNTLPITSAAVAASIGNIGAILDTI